MNGYCMLDFANGITFLAFKSEDVDAFERALDQYSIKYQRERFPIEATGENGKPTKIFAERLVIDPTAGTAHISDMFQSMSRG